MKKLLLLQIILLSFSLKAELKMPAIFGDNMVLQRNLPVPVWGWSAPGEKITIKFNKQEKSTRADKTGKWMVRLEPLSASSKGKTLTVTAGEESREFNNVLVGEVWLCSGQSNMASGFKYLRITKEIEGVSYPLLRLSNGTKWELCNTDSLQKFSAVGYYFGLKLRQELRIPVGLINIAAGCSSIENWMPPESFKDKSSLVDANGCGLLDEMSIFQHFYANYEKLSDKIKQQTFLEHCTGKYTFAKIYLKNGKPEPEKYKNILKHMCVVKPAFSYETRIKPVVPYALRGVIWYQGETNIRDRQYARKQQLLIENWRKIWNEGNFPFYLVLLAPCKDGKDAPLPEFWMQQYKAVGNTVNTGLIAAVDIGNFNEYHPLNKRDVGKRLALLALRNTYGMKNIIASGPTFKSMSIKDGKVVIDFDHAATGLITNDGKAPAWFELAGADKKFSEAKAGIIKNTVILSSPSVKNPVFVRYAWSSRVNANLCNKSGLPAFPFNTAYSFFHNNH